MYRLAEVLCVDEHFVDAGTVPILMVAEPQHAREGGCSVEERDAATNGVIGFDLWACSHPWNGHVFGHVGTMGALVASVVGLDDDVTIRRDSSEEFTDQGVDMGQLVEIPLLHPAIDMAGGVDRPVVDKHKIIALCLNDPDGFAVHFVIVTLVEGRFMAPAV